MSRTALHHFSSSHDHVGIVGTLGIHTGICVVIVVVTFQQRVALCRSGLFGEMLVFDFLELDHSVLVALEGI